MSFDVQVVNPLIALIAGLLILLMPRLLNEYLGTDFPQSPDRYFLSPGPLEPLVLTEIDEPSAAPAGP